MWCSDESIQRMAGADEIKLPVEGASSIRHGVLPTE
jgi:hypothetical protein